MFITNSKLSDIIIYTKNGLDVVKKNSVVLYMDKNGLYSIYGVGHLSIGDIKWCLEHGSIDTTKYIYVTKGKSLTRIRKDSLSRQYLVSEKGKVIIVYTDGTYVSGGIHRRDLRLIKGYRGDYVIRDSVFYYLTMFVKRRRSRNVKRLSKNIEIKGYKGFFLSRNSIININGEKLQTYKWILGVRYVNINNNLISLSEAQRLVFDDTYWGDIGMARDVKAKLEKKFHIDKKKKIL